MAHNDPPPAFERSNLVELVSVDDSKIINASLYSGQAEITCLFKFEVKLGQNQVHVTGLPATLDDESIRVEGRGAATIHDVTISRVLIPNASVSTTHTALERKRDSLEEALQRCNVAQESIAAYLRSLSVQHVDPSNLENILEKSEVEGQKLAERVLDLRRELKGVKDDIEAEKAKTIPKNPLELNWKAVIGIFSETEGEVEITLVYVVRSAIWTAGYDIRVDTQTKEKSVKLIYKAAIRQRTGEAWDDVPLTLETATPTFGVGIHELGPWYLSANQNIDRTGVNWPEPTSFTVKNAARARVHSRMLSLNVGTSADSDDVQMAHGNLRVTSNSTVNATFSVPGLITIPSDNETHNVTIVQLELDAALSWIAVPKLDTKTRLNAKIKNASEYTFLSGTASVYVDRSFISKSQVPAVSPQESFDCPLGLDPSIRITYHPQSKTTSKSGFYQKSATHSYTQIISVINTKMIDVESLKIIDRFPVSQDSDISVKYISPALNLPFNSTETVAGSGSDTGNVVPPLVVATGVVAQWDGAEDLHAERSALGKDGKLNWICSVPAQGKLNLVLKWDVVAPTSLNINGL